MIMAEGKSKEELMLEDQLQIILAKEREAKRRASAEEVELDLLDLDKEDIVKGIVLKEILGLPKAFER